MLWTKKGIGPSGDGEAKDRLKRDTPWLAGLYGYGVRRRIATGPNTAKRLSFRELFNGKLEMTRSDLWDCLAGLAGVLEAAELLPEIRRAYEDGLLAPEMNITEEIEEYLSERDQLGLIDDYFPLVNAH